MKFKSVVIYEDDNLIVVNKAAGIHTVADRYDHQAPYLLQWLNQNFGRVLPVHRLDSGTSGVICFAKTPEEQKRLSQLFESREIVKRYKAIVAGVPVPPEGIIDAPIYKPANKHQVMISPKGKKAITWYKVENAFGNFALLDLLIETGRTHQIRVHLQYIGHPLLVDPLYGGRSSFFLSSIKARYKGDRFEETPLLGRTPLHAYQLTIPMAEGYSKTFETPLPKDMQAVINQLSKLKVRS